MADLNHLVFEKLKVDRPSGFLFILVFLFHIKKKNTLFLATFNLKHRTRDYVVDLYHLVFEKLKVDRPTDLFSF